MIQLASQAPSHPSPNAVSWRAAVRGKVAAPGSARLKPGSHAWPFLSRSPQRPGAQEVADSGGLLASSLAGGHTGQAG